MAHLDRSSLPAAQLDESTVRPNWYFLGLAGLIFSCFSLYFGHFSQGFLEADACTHYLFARWSLAQPHYLVDVWGRPLFTLIYALPAGLAGRAGAQITSLLIALACAGLTTLIARRQGMAKPELAGLFVLAQPLVFLHSFSEMTELTFALLVCAALWAYQRKKWELLALFGGLMPLGRPEGFGFLLLAAAGLFLYRKWWWLILLAIPLVVWNYAGWYLFGQSGSASFWLVNHWPYSSTSVYAAGPLGHFVGLLPMLIGPLVFPALFVGICQSVKRLVPFGRWLGQAAHRPDESLDPKHQACVQLVILAVPLGVLLIHSLLYWRGRMASNGELRYLMVASPMWALLVTQGWQWVFDRLRWKYMLSTAAVAAILPLGMNWFWAVLPLKYAPDWATSQALAGWYQNSPISHTHPHLMASHIALYYFADISNSDPERSRYWNLATIRQRPPHTLLIWDPVFALYNSDQNLRVQISDIEAAGWQEIPWPLGGAPDSSVTTTQPVAAAQSTLSLSHNENGWRIFRSD